MRTQLQTFVLLSVLVSAHAMAGPLSPSANDRGSITATKLWDEDNTTFYVDPSFNGVSLWAAGQLYINAGTSGTAMWVNGAEALWYNGTYFSWGYGGTANYFADKVGIGITNPSDLLQVSSSVGNTIVTFEADTDNNNENDNVALHFEQDGGATWGKIGLVSTNHMQIEANNNLLFWNGGSNRVTFSNTSPYAYKTGGGSWGTISDRRLKKDIREFSEGLSVIRKIRPVRYFYNDRLKNLTDDAEHIGVIAQDLSDVAPYMVSTFPEDSETDGEHGEEFLAVDPSAFTYLLVNSVQELEKRDNENKSRIAALETENAAMRAFLCAKFADAPNCN